jgi:hypothetical protein
MRIKLAGSVLILCGSMVGACAIDDQEQDNQEQGDEDEDLQSTEQAVYSGWTFATSEEYPPYGCDGASLVNGVRCTGGYCDNVALYCVPTGGARGGSFWTTYFSEEGVNYRYCAYGQYITAVSCRGGWCDNVALQCTYIANITRGDCHWTGYISEEYGGTLYFGTGYYAVGARCAGAYCDNMSFYVCRV